MEEAIRNAAWFPSGIATGLESIEVVLDGFSRWRLSTSWGTFDILHMEDFDWGSIEGEVWGEVPKSARVSHSEGTSFQLLAEDGDWRAEHLPFGNALEGVEVLGDLIEMPCGGLRFEGRDVLLFWRGKEEGEALSKALAEDPIATCKVLGSHLGKVATAAMDKSSTGNEERAWNDRLKKMEDRLKTNTLWRAPHSPETRGTLTLRHLRPEHIRVVEGRLVLGGIWGGLESMLLKMSQKRPAISDLGAVFTLAHEFCPQNQRQEALRTLGESWVSTAPESISNRRALDGHRGGLHIWVYEAMLNRMMMARAMNEDGPRFVVRWLAQVSTIQAAMFQARSWSALALMCFLSSALVPFAWLWGYLSTNEMILSPVFLVAGMMLRRMYRGRAPSPW